MPTGECRCLAVSWDMPQSQQLPLYCLNRKTFFACGPTQRSCTGGNSNAVTFCVAMRFWSVAAMEEDKISNWWAPANLSISFRTLWSQLSFCLRFNMATEMPQGTFADNSAPMKLVSWERGQAGDCTKGSEPQGFPYPGVGGASCGLWYCGGNKGHSSFTD